MHIVRYDRAVSQTGWAQLSTSSTAWCSWPTLLTLSCRNTLTQVCTCNYACMLVHMHALHKCSHASAHACTSPDQDSDLHPSIFARCLLRKQKHLRFTPCVTPRFSYFPLWQILSFMLLFLELSSVLSQDGIVAIRNALRRSTPSLRSFTKVLQNSASICLVEHEMFLTWRMGCHLFPSHSPLSFRWPVLWCCSFTLHTKFTQVCSLTLHRKFSQVCNLTLHRKFSQVCSLTLHTVFSGLQFDLAQKVVSSLQFDLAQKVVSSLQFDLAQKVVSSLQFDLAQKVFSSLSTFMSCQVSWGLVKQYYMQNWPEDYL